MIISEKQIAQLIAIANAHAANSFIQGENEHAIEIQNLLATIIQQQPEELREVK